MPEGYPPARHQQHTLAWACILVHAAVLVLLASLLLLQVASAEALGNGNLKRIALLTMIIQTVVQTPLALSVFWRERERLHGWKRCMLIAPIPVVVGIELIYFLLTSLLRTMGGAL